MKKQFWLIIPFIFSSFVTTSFPALSQDSNTKAITAEKSSPQTNNKITVITALIVKFTDDTKFDPSADKEVPLVLHTIAPISNSAGRVIIPANSRVAGKLVTTGKGKNKGTMIVGTSLILNGKSYPINATVNAKLPAEKVPGKSPKERAQEYVSIVNQVLSPSGATNSLDSGNTTGSPQSSKNQVNQLIRQAASVVGILNPRSKRKLNITKGSEYILNLEKPLRFCSTQNIQ